MTDGCEETFDGTNTSGSSDEDNAPAVHAAVPQLPVLASLPSWADDTSKDYLITVTRSGHDVSSALFQLLQSWLRQHASTWTATVERGGKDSNKHFHAVARLPLDDSNRSKKTRLLADLRSSLHIQPNTGFKLQVKPCTGGADAAQGALQYICKEFSEAHFQAVDQDGRTHLENTSHFEALGKQYIHSHGGELGKLSFLRYVHVQLEIVKQNCKNLDSKYIFDYLYISLVGGINYFQKRTRMQQIAHRIWLT